MNPAVIVIAEHSEGELSPATFETLSCAVEIASKLGQSPRIVMAGKDMDSLAHETAGRTGFDVTVIENDSLPLYNGEVYKEIFSELLGDSGPAYICIPHTAGGWDFAPGLALRLGASCITAVEKTAGEGRHISFIRSQWGGKVQAEVAPLTEGAVVTILPGAWHPFEGIPNRKGTVQIVRTGRPPQRSKTLCVKGSTHIGSNLKDAEVILSAGKGLGGRENLHLLHELAEIFPRSAVGASRAACDAGWIDYGRQIGQTGKTVSPKLYLACGISGSTQHIAGMKGSRMVIAINTDPHAPIFGIADFGIVDDMSHFIPALLEAYRRHQRK